MNRIVIIFAFIIPLMVFSQESKVNNDTLLTIHDNQYIQNHSNQLNIKFEVGNELINYFVPFEGNKANIKTNLNIRYALVFSYKFVSVRIGVRPGISETEKENKGESDTFRFRIKLLFDKWSHQFEYNYNKGYYIENSNSIFSNANNPDFHVQFPNLTTKILTGSSLFKFNDEYSIKAVESNTEIQLKSAGTFLPSINYSLYNITGIDKIKNDQGDIIEREVYQEYNGINIILNAGYHYTFVLHKYWYVNIFANPGVGIDFYKTTFISPNEIYKRSFNEPFLFFGTGVAAGYNGKKYFFGLEYDTQISSEKFDDSNIQLQPSKNSFHVFIGYRFKAPKTISKPIDDIENKIPILKENNNLN